jgi:TolB-like protein/tetratricopeptide (TPR) repeat protein
VDKADGTVTEPAKERAPRRWLLPLAGVVAVAIGVTLALNAGGLRDRFLGGGRPDIHAIALIPFENPSNDPAQQHIADGLTQAVLMDLQRLPGVLVIATASVRQALKGGAPMPEVAARLNVDAVLQGSVLQSAGRLQIAVKLSEMPVNRQVWAQTYERDLAEMPRWQGEFVRDVARQINAPLGVESEASLTSRPRVDAHAYEACLRALTVPTAKREVLLREAVGADPPYGAGYALLAEIRLGRNMYALFSPAESHPESKQMAQKALTFEPDSAVSHNVLASVAAEYDWDFAGAETQFKLATEIAPSRPWAHHMYAHFLLAMGRFEEARAETERTIDINPANATTFDCVSRHDITVGNYEQAEKRARQALEMGAPEQLARLTLGWSYQLRGRHEEAIHEFQKAVVGWNDAVFPTATLGHAYAVAGRQEAAREVLGRLLERSKAGTAYVSPYEIAVVYAGLGEKDRAFEWLEKAFEDRATQLVYFRMDPRIWSLTDDARFQALLDRMNFPKDARNR